MKNTNLVEKIFSIASEEEFNEVALEVFNFQFKNNSFMSEDTKQFIICFKCQREFPNDLQNIVGSSEAEQIISQTPLKKNLEQKNWRKSVIRIKAMMTLP